MPGSDVPDYRTPSPDAGHEAIRKPLADAIDDLAEASVGVEDSYFLTDMLFSLIDSLLASADDMQVQVADLTERLAALEPPFVPTDPEEPA